MIEGGLLWISSSYHYEIYHSYHPGIPSVLGGLCRKWGQRPNIYVSYYKSQYRIFPLSRMKSSGLVSWPPHEISEASLPLLFLLGHYLLFGCVWGGWLGGMKAATSQHWGWEMKLGNTSSLGLYAFGHIITTLRFSCRFSQGWLCSEERRVFLLSLNKRRLLLKKKLFSHLLNGKEDFQNYCSKGHAYCNRREEIGFKSRYSKGSWELTTSEQDEGGQWMESY